MIKAANRTKNFTYAIRNIVSEAKKIEAEGKKVTYLNIGDPVPYGFNTPPHLVEAVEKALRDGHNGYAPSPGIPQAREAVAREALRRGIKMSPDDVIITSGASEAADIVLSSMLEPGDEVLVPSPGYPLYTAILAKLGAKEVSYKLDPKNNWQPSVDDIRALINNRTRAIVIINPNNPTGAIYSKENLLEVLSVANQAGLVILADEVYWRMAYETVAPPIASLVDESVPVITFESMSKIYLAPGWRVGWMKISNPHLMTDLRVGINKMADARLCSARPPQHAVAAALDGDHTYLEDVMNRFRARRDLSHQRINAIEGMNCTLPQGAFYLMAQMQQLGDATDEQFVVSLLRETGVLFVHGSGFGMDPQEGYFRIVYLPELDVLNDVYDRLAEFVYNWQKHSKGAVG
ncbi:MAG: aminotransferase class I/II-fold pyridoxal phosphate-dependent enzyme [Acidobacteria bacterium]|nr:aminotransferase class I/II-fold pyridoxal phosphate-dependent enzyme [Acidobacteriota bacterium]